MSRNIEGTTIDSDRPVVTPWPALTNTTEKKERVESQDSIPCILDFQEAQVHY